MRKLKNFLDHLQNNNDPQTVIFSENGIFKRKLKSKVFCQKGAVSFCLPENGHYYLLNKEETFLY